MRRNVVICGFDFGLRSLYLTRYISGPLDQYRKPC